MVADTHLDTARRFADYLNVTPLFWGAHPLGREIRVAQAVVGPEGDVVQVVRSLGCEVAVLLAFRPTAIAYHLRESGPAGWAVLSRHKRIEAVHLLELLAKL